MNRWEFWNRWDTNFQGLLAPRAVYQPQSIPKFSVNRAEPNYKWILNQSNLFVAGKHGDVKMFHIAKVGDVYEWTWHRRAVLDLGRAWRCLSDIWCADTHWWQCTLYLPRFHVDSSWFIHTVRLHKDLSVLSWHESSRGEHADICRLRSEVTHWALVEHWLIPRSPNKCWPSVSEDMVAGCLEIRYICV